MGASRRVYRVTYDPKNDDGSISMKGWTQRVIATSATNAERQAKFLIPPGMKIRKIERLGKDE